MSPSGITSDFRGFRREKEIFFKKSGNFRLRFSGFFPKIGAPPLSSILFTNRENTLSVLSIVAYAVSFVKVFIEPMDIQPVDKRPQPCYNKHPDRVFSIDDAPTNWGFIKKEITAKFVGLGGYFFLFLSMSTTTKLKKTRRYVDSERNALSFYYLNKIPTPSLDIPLLPKANGACPSI
jgi:hypothetical protein